MRHESQDAGLERSTDAWRYQTLLEVSDFISLHTDLKQLLRDIAASLRDLVDFDVLGVTLPDEANRMLQVFVRVFLGEGGAAQAETPRMTTGTRLEDTPLGVVWASQSPLVFNDLEHEERFPEFMPEMRKHMRALCLLPLRTALRPVGVLGFCSKRADAYQQADLAFLERIAAQVAIAIDNVRNHERAVAYQQQLEADRDHWRALLEINNAIVSNLDLAALSPAIASSLHRVVAHDFATLALLDPDSRGLRFRQIDTRGTGEAAFTPGTVPLDDTPIGRSLLLRQPIVVDHVDAAMFPEGLPGVDEAVRAKRLCCVPLVTARRALGAIVLTNRDPEAFGDGELQRLTQAAGQIAIAIENGLSFQEIATLKDRLALENLYLEDEVRGKYDFDEIVGESKGLRRVLAQVRSVAATETTVLLLGETGTGKELIARAIHKLSPRRDRTLVTVNCATSPAGLLESEWFGHEKGAFTGALAQKVGRFELAHQGTLFLDEVGDVPLELQAKLLRVLQEHEIERLGSTRSIHVDFRLVAATNRDLEQMVADRLYRSDLFYRLNVFPVRIPPLRERPEDIPQLVRYFTQKYARRMKKPIDAIPREVMEALTRWSWPGNVRELQNVIERAVILSPGTSLRVPLSELASSADPVNGMTLEAVEREHILRTLADTGWVIGGVAGAAARLGLKRTTLVSTMRRLGITRPKPGRL